MSRQLEDQFERQYLHDELVRFRELFGTKQFWSQAEANRERALNGLCYVYLHTHPIAESDVSFFQVTIDEYHRRALLLGV